MKYIFLLVLAPLPLLSCKGTRVGIGIGTVLDDGRPINLNVQFGSGKAPISVTK